MTLCKCGCGGEAEPGNEYINGHQNRGKNHPIYGKKPWNYGKTKKTDDRVVKNAEGVSKSLKKFYQTEEGKKLAEETSNRFKGISPWSEGLTKETDERVRTIGENNSRIRKIFFASEEGQQWLDKNMRGENKIRRVFFQTEEGQRWLDDNLRGKNHPMYGKHPSDETLKKMLKAVCAAPNKKEQYLYWILQEIFPNEYKFVGDGSVIIGGYCPDFINTNGQKKLIEHFGDYWHKGDDEGNRIFQFKLFGFDTLIIWEHELDDNEIEMTIAKIIEFHYRK